MSKPQVTVVDLDEVGRTLRDNAAKFKEEIKAKEPDFRRRDIANSAIDTESQMLFEWWQELLKNEEKDQALLDLLHDVQHACMNLRNHFRRLTESTE